MMDKKKIGKSTRSISRKSFGKVAMASIVMASLALVPGTEALASNQPVTITVWTYGKFKVGPQISKMFNASHPGIKLVFTPVPIPPGGQSFYSFISGKLTAAEMAGTPPNIVLNDQGTTAAWAAKGLLMPMDNYVKQIGIQSQDFPKTAWDSASYNGQLYGSPVDWDPDNMMFYNLKLMKAAGIKTPPKTFDELWADSQKLTLKKKGQYSQMGFIPWLGYVFNVFGWAHLYGGTPIKPDGTITLNSPAMVKSLTWEQQWAKTYKPNLIGNFQSSVPSTMDPFIAGKLGFMVDGDWELPSLQSYGTKFKFGKDWNVTTAPLPKGGKDDYLGSGWAWVIPNHAKNLDQTVEVVKWLSTPAVTSKWCVVTGWIPASNLVLKQATPGLIKANPAFGPFIKEREQHPNLTPEFAASPNVLPTEVEGTSAEDKVIHLTESPSQAANNAQSRAQSGM